MSKKIKRHSGAFIFASLVLILSFMILDFISLPTYGVSKGIVCATGFCLCFCRDINGGCVCRVNQGVSCTCWCPNGNWDECVEDKW